MTMSAHRHCTGAMSDERQSASDIRFANDGQATGAEQCVAALRRKHCIADRRLQLRQLVCAALSVVVNEIMNREALLIAS